MCVSGRANGNRPFRKPRPIIVPMHRMCTSPNWGLAAYAINDDISRGFRNLITRSGFHSASRHRECGGLLSRRDQAGISSDREGSQRALTRVVIHAESAVVEESRYPAGPLLTHPSAAAFARTSVALFAPFAPSIGASAPSSDTASETAPSGDHQAVAKRGLEGLAIAFPALGEHLRQATETALRRRHPADALEELRALPSASSASPASTSSRAISRLEELAQLLQRRRLRFLQTRRRCQGRTSAWGFWPNGLDETFSADAR